MRELANEIEKVEQQANEDAMADIMLITLTLIKAVQSSAKKTKVRTVSDTGKVTYKTVSTIPPQALSQLKSDIAKYEKDIGSSLYNSIVSSMETSVDTTIQTLVDAIDDITSVPKIDVKSELVDEVVIGDKTTKQRSSQVSTGMSSDVQKAIRKGALGGDELEDVLSAIRETIDDYTWEVERIIESEVWNAYRYTFGQVADDNDFEWIRLHESFPRHRNRKKHRCYPLANTDKYGKGKGVWKSTDIEIFYPHPQCTSWLELMEGL